MGALRGMAISYERDAPVQAEGASELAGALSFNDHSRLTKLFMHKNPLGEDGVRELQKFLEDCPKVRSPSLSGQKLCPFEIENRRSCPSPLPSPIPEPASAHNQAVHAQESSGGGWCARAAEVFGGLSDGALRVEGGGDGEFISHNISLD